MPASATRTRLPRGILGRAGDYARGFAELSGNARRLLVATTCLWVGIGIFGVLFNLYLIAVGYSVAFVGALAAVSTVGQASASPLLGRLLRRWPARTVMLAATAVAAATMAASAVLAQALPLILVTAVLGAAIAAATIPASPFIMEQSTADRRAHLFSAYGAASTVGSLAGSLISGALATLGGVLPALRGQPLALEHVGLLIGAAVTAVGVPSLWRLTDERIEDDLPVPPAGAPDSGAAAPDETRVDVLAMMAATACTAVALGLVYPLFNVYFATVHHASTATIGLLYAISGVFCTIGALLGPIAARLGTLRGLVIMRACTAPILLIFWLQPGLAVVFVAYVSRNILGQVTGTLENAFAMTAVPTSLRGAVASWRAFSFNAGWTLGSLVAGVVVSRFGFSSAFAASAALTIAGALAWYLRFGRGPSPARRFPVSGATGD